MSLRRLYARFFAFIYDPFMHKFERYVLAKHRKALLSGLHGRILEIGAGSGVNLAFYNASEVHEVVAVEPNKHLWRRAEAKMQSMPTSGVSTRPLHAGINEPLVKETIADESLDAAVCTLVLCTIPHPEQTIGDVYRWLKPGGRLIVLEHIRSHHRGTSFLQDLFNPAWRIVADGCHLNRATDRALKSSGFQMQEESYFSATLPFYKAVFTKPQA